MTAPLAGARFPRDMVASPAHERLLEFLGAELVDDCDATLADHARAWLATAKQGNAESAAAIRKVRDALDSLTLIRGRQAFVLDGREAERLKVALETPLPEEPE